MASVGGPLTLRSLFLPLAILALVVPFASPAQSAGTAPTFGASVALPNSWYYGEPSITTAPDGTLYVAAPCSHTCVWRSVDHGASWKRVADTLGSSGDSDIVVDAAGTVYASDLFTKVPVSVSTDKAASWSFVAPSMAASSVDRQWLAVWGTGNVWSSVNEGGSVHVSASHDGARTWSEVTAFTDADFPPPGQMVATSALDLYIGYPATNGYLRVAASHDGGVSWSSHNVAPYAAAPPLGDTVLFPTVAGDANGTLYVVWADSGAPTSASQPAYGTRVRIATSHDHGDSWSAPRTLSPPSDYAIDPWVVADAAGHVAVAWYEGVPPAVVQVMPGAADLTQWHVEVAYAQDADQPTPHWSTLAATGVTHTGPICETGTGCSPEANPIAQNRILLDFFEMTEQSDGGIAIAYAGDQPSVQGQLTGVYTQLYVVTQDGGPNLK